MAYSEDHIALAAEYALGTLDADERAQVETMMAVDTEFTAIVHAWEYRLGVLNQMVGSIEPRPIVWENIKAAIGHSAGSQTPLVLLAYYNGWSREQLAAKFETPVNTVKTWLRRSMMDIRECLGL